MKPAEAIQLDNWFPDTGFVKVRPGHEGHATGVGSGLVKSVFAWWGPGSQKLLAAGGGEIYNASSAGSASALTSNSYNSDEWQTVNYGNHVTGVNGSDTPWHYNGTTFANSAWTGVTQTNLINVAVFNNRLYFVEKDAAHFWYSNTSHITGGALTKFDLAQITEHGGKLMAQGAWSTSKGQALQQLLVSVFDTGEVIVYSGDDPASNFVIRGRYKTAEPIGRRCLTNIGGDLVILTKSGLIPVSLLLTIGETDAVEANKVWGKIRPAIRDLAALHGDKEGWDSFLSPLGDFALWNVPTVAGQEYKQVVLNPLTGAWCRYTCLPSYCWASVAGITYFGSTGGKLFKHSGNKDDGANIHATARTAFDYFGSPGRKKTATAVRPNIRANGQLLGSVGVDVDFSNRNFPPNTVTFGAAGTTTPWGSPWGSPWGAQPAEQLDWYSVGGSGRAFSLFLQTSTGANTVQWTATDYLGQLGAVR